MIEIRNYQLLPFTVWRTSVLLFGTFLPVHLLFSRFLKSKYVKEFWSRRIHVHTWNNELNCWRRKKLFMVFPKSEIIWLILMGRDPAIPDAYTAPFPSSLYKAGAARWPLLVPMIKWGFFYCPVLSTNYWKAHKVMSNTKWQLKMSKICNSHNFPIPSLEILCNYEWYRDDPVTAHMMEAKECLSKWSKPALVMFSTKWDFARCWSYLAHFEGTEPNKPNIEVLTHHVPPGTQWLVGRTKSSWSWSLMQRKRWSTSFGLKREFKLVTFCLSIQLKARVGITFFFSNLIKNKEF